MIYIYDFLLNMSGKNTKRYYSDETPIVEEIVKLTKDKTY